MQNGLKNLKRSELVTLAKKAASEERKAHSQFIGVLKEIARRELYLEMGYGSLFAFVENELGYSGGSAARRVQAVEAALALEKSEPELEKKIEAGSLNLSTLSQVGRFIKREKYEANRIISETEKKKILEAVIKKPEREVLKALTEFTDLAPHPEKSVQERVISKTETLLSVRVEEALYQEIEEVKLILSHVNPTMNTLEAIRYLVKDFLKRRSPMKALQKGSIKSVQKVNRLRALSPGTPVGISGESIQNKRTPSAVLKRQVFEKHGHQCAYHDRETDRRCENRYRLEIDHKTPFSKNGQTALDNLRPLCQRHHAYVWKTQQHGLPLQLGAG